MKVIYVNGGIAGVLDYLVHEWANKAAGIANYRGVSARTRGANSHKSDLAALKKS